MFFNVFYSHIDFYNYDFIKSTTVYVACAEDLPEVAPPKLSWKKMEDKPPTISPAMRRQLLRGNMYSLPTLQSRVVRIFISSSFSGNL